MLSVYILPLHKHTLNRKHKMVHKCYCHFHNRLGLGICGLFFPSLISDLYIARKADPKKLSNFAKVSNDLFFCNCKCYQSRIKVLQNCLAFSFLDSFFCERKSEIIERKWETHNPISRLWTLSRNNNKLDLKSKKAPMIYSKEL